MCAGGGPSVSWLTCCSLQLAYPMKKQKQKSRFGFLYRFRSECAPANIISLDRLLRLDENVIRHMTTKLNPTKVLNDIIPQENPVLVYILNGFPIRVL